MLTIFRRKNRRTGIGHRQRPGLSALEARLAPATFTVLNLNNSGAGSLRQAVLDANALAGADSIVFQAGLTGTIVLTSEIVITGSVTIDGPGVLTLAVSGGNTTRIFDISGASSPTVNLVDLQLTNGSVTGASGGAIRAEGGKLSLTNCLVINSQAKTSGGSGGYGGGLFADDTLVTISGSTFSGNSAQSGGGGIQLRGGSLSMTKSALNFNAAGFGGGADLEGTTSTNVIVDSTIANNVANAGGGGGMSISGGKATNDLELIGSTISGNTAQIAGGGIFLSLGFLFTQSPVFAVLRNSTVSGNFGGAQPNGASAGGIYVSDKCSLLVENSTIVRNTSTSGTLVGSGISHNNSDNNTLLITSSIVAENISPDGVSDRNVRNALGFNSVAIYSALGLSLGFNFTGGNNLPTGAALKLGPLANNGGPTQTHLPANDSPVRGKGSNPSGLTTDQRGAGFLRDINGAPDIGAVETAPQYVVRNINDSGPDSLRAQIADANVFAGTQTISFDANVFATDQTIKLGSGELVISSPMTIAAPALGLVTISGNNLMRIFNTAPAPDFTPINLTNLILTKGSSADGGAIYAEEESLSLFFCRLENNKASAFGGAISVRSSAGAAKLVLDTTAISGNQASTGGGVALFTNVSTTVVNSSITGNTAVNGGAIYSKNQLGPLTISNSTLSGNTADGNGAIALRDAFGTTRIRNSTVVFNEALVPGSIAGVGQVGGTAGIEVVSSILSANKRGPDLFSLTPLTANFSAIGSTGNAPVSGANNLPLGTDVKLGPLGLNGGVTRTHLPNLDSPVIGAGSNPDGLTNDQRGPGFGRARGAVDIGAVEAAVDLVVTNANDAGPGSLRQAALDANAFFGAETITFSPTFFTSAKSITLTTGAINLTDAVTIQGPAAARVTVSGYDASAIFNSIGGGANALVFNDLTLTAAVGGAFVGFEDQVTFNRCVITGNKSAGRGAGLVLTGTYTAALNLLDTTISGNSATTKGGGIYLSDKVSVSIVNSTISGNTAGNAGGGLYFFGAVGPGGFTIRNSTFSGNQASAGGGAIALRGNAISTGTVVIQNSTLTANTAVGSSGGAISQTSGIVAWSVESSIIWGNTGGLAADINATKAVAAKNSALGFDLGFTLTDLGGNLPLGTDVKLGPLAVNGGPTQTHALALDSPAINKGSNPATLTTDQRGTGFNRVELGAIDIGAFEARLVVDTTVDENDGNFGLGDLSLREAIALANTTYTGADTITFDPIAFATPQTITLSLGEMTITNSLTIVGPDAKLTVSGNNASRIFKLSPAGANLAVTFDGVTLTKGNSGTNPGGAIFLQGFGFSGDSLTIRNCTITGNTAGGNGGNGGGISITSSLLTIEDSTISNNTSLLSNGGGISATFTGMKTIIRRSIITGNSARGGSGIEVNGNSYAGGFSLIEDTTISNNVSNYFLGSGGGLSMTGSANTIRNTTITGNSAYIGGGLVGGALPIIVIQNSTIAYNTATFRTGGLENGLFKLESSIVSKNSAPNGPDFFFATVEAKNSSIFSSSGITTFTDLGGNRPFGEDPLLAPLANNGGPTQTHGLLPGSPLIDKGSNPASLAFDQRGVGFNRVLSSQADIGAFEGVVPVATPAKVQSVTINDGSAQRSRVTSLRITFDQNVGSPPASAFQLLNQKTALAPTIAAVADNTGPTTVVTLTFTGSSVEATSLADGRYTLTITAGAINGGAFDGNGDGIVGDDYALVGTPTNGLFRLFGDADGNGSVTAIDFNAFRLAYGTSGSSIFDFNSDNQVSAADFNEFRLRYGAVT